MPTLREMLADPDFKALSKKDQEDLITEKTMSLKQSAKPRELNPVSMLTGQPHQDGQVTPGSFRDMFQKNAQNSNTPQSSKLLDLGFGALAGSTMPGSTPTGAATIGATTMAFPPKTPGDYASIAAAGPLAELTGPISQLPKTQLGRIAAQGGLGGASMEGLHALSEQTNRMTGGPQGNLGTADPLSLALSMGGPMLVQKLLAEKVASNPKVKARDFANEFLMQGRQGQASTPGLPASLQAMDKLPAMNPGASPDLASAMLAGRTVPAAIQPLEAQITAAETRRQEIQQRLLLITEESKNIDVAKAGRSLYDSRLKATQQKIKTDATLEQLQMRKQIDDLIQKGATENTPALIQARANLRKVNRFGATEQVRQKADDVVTKQMLAEQEQKAQIITQKAEQVAASGQSGLDLSDVKTESNTNTTNVKVLNRQQKRLGVETASLTGEKTLLQNSLIDLRNKTDEQWRAMHPELRAIAQESLTPGTGKGGLLTNLMNASPEGVAAYKAHLAAQPNGADHVAALQNGMAEEFFKRAYDPATKTLKNAPDLFKGAFSRDKIAAIYGEDKATTVQNAVVDIERWATQTSGIPGMARYAIHRTGWLLPQAVLFSEGLSHGNAQMAVAAGGAGLVTIAYPKLLNILLESPKYADDFHRIATKVSPNMTLANFPTLAARIAKESRKVPSLADVQNSIEPPPPPPPPPAPPGPPPQQAQQQQMVVTNPNQPPPQGGVPGQQ